ncbi:hypothetical protein [Rhizobium sp. S163]|uniref:hypothetical protein n=1 Tax=Rhizobium sp. S163 TaxID=3055039 RepID=UPI0025A98A3F|nr:hypothetical protein [Rhizobium sp. S163]MDM9647116.1 hypothetical protein [Rhizobium sp. S163]
MNLADKSFRLREEAQSYVENLFRSKAVFDINPESDPAIVEHHISKHLYFFTAHLKYKMLPNSSSKQEYAMNAFRKYYIEMQRELIEHSRQTVMQPLTYVAYDVEGSRYNSPAIDAQIPHLHGLMLLHPKTRDNFVRALEAKMLTKNSDGSIEKVTFEAHRGGLEDLSRIVDYTIKHSTTLQGNNYNFQPDMLLPDLKPKLYPFYKSL